MAKHKTFTKHFTHPSIVCPLTPRPSEIVTVDVRPPMPLLPSLSAPSEGLQVFILAGASEYRPVYSYEVASVDCLRDLGGSEGGERLREGTCVNQPEFLHR
jgi:hypothetical protein